MFNKEKINYIRSKENTLELLLEKYPDKDWNLYALSSNPNVYWDFIYKNKQKNWDFSEVSKNINNSSDNSNIINIYTDYNIFLYYNFNINNLVFFYIV